MGGRGTNSVGNKVSDRYETVDIIDGVKALVPKDKTVALKLPEESHSSSAYVLYDRDGVFHQYREYNSDHLVSFEIGYHHEKSLGTGDVLHVHIYNQPGVDNRRTATKRLLLPGDPLYEKYKKFFKGVK